MSSLQFQAARPDIIRAINQCWLLNYWKQARGDRRLPPWQEMEGRGFAGMISNLSLLDVSGSNGDTRFRVRFHGARVGEAYGSTDCQGRYLDEILAPATRDAGLATYRHVVATGQPVYTSADITDIDGHLVHFERLLLPFSEDGETVNRILASLEMISPDGAFTARDLMVSPRAPKSYAVYATIAAGT